MVRLADAPAARRPDSIEADKSTAKGRQENAGKIEPRRHGEHDDEELRRVFSNSGLDLPLVVPVVSSWFKHLLTWHNRLQGKHLRLLSPKSEKATQSPPRQNSTISNLARRTVSGVGDKVSTRVATETAERPPASNRHACRRRVFVLPQYLGEKPQSPWLILAFGGVRRLILLRFSRLE
jgi:hypothetical protein